MWSIIGVYPDGAGGFVDFNGNPVTPDPTIFDDVEPPNDCMAIFNFDPLFINYHTLACSNSWPATAIICQRVF